MTALVGDSGSPKRPKPPQIEITAKVEGLVDIVEVGGKTIYLFVEDGLLRTKTEVVEDGITKMPPSLAHLDYLVPRFVEVARAYCANESLLQLFADLWGWHEFASKLADVDYYIIVLFDFHTYLADRADYSPILLLQTEGPERGKSRQGKSIAYVAYRGIATETLREANLFRWADSLGCTIFLDVRDLMQKALRQGSDDILLSRFDRHGPKVSRVYDPQANAFEGVKSFAVYGPTVIASNKPVVEPLLSRGLPINPLDAPGKYGNVRPEDALHLRERLVAFRARHMHQQLPIVDKPADGRLGDITQSLYQIAVMLGDDIPGQFPAAIEEMQRRRSMAKSTSDEAVLLLAFLAAHTITNGLNVSVSLITMQYNNQLGRWSRVTEVTVGRGMADLGFTPARVTGGGRAWVWNQDRFDELIKRYGLT